MDENSSQLDLFSTPSLNPTYEIKHQIRLALSKINGSRDEFVEEMNTCAVRSGIRNSISKATLDGWCKDSDPSRLPSLPMLVIFCRVAGTAEPLRPLLAPLGYGVIGPEDVGLLKWARDYQEKRSVSKRERLSQAVLDLNK